MLYREGAGTAKGTYSGPVRGFDSIAIAVQFSIVSGVERARYISPANAIHPEQT